MAVAKRAVSLNPESTEEFCRFDNVCKSCVGHPFWKRMSRIGLQLPIQPTILRTRKDLRLSELRFRAPPLFLATILGGNRLQTLK
jgi:hypothetical protein